MSRWVLVLGLVACKGADRGPIHDGISRVAASVTSRGGEGSYLELRFMARVQQPVEGSYGLTVRAACQVGADRLVELEPVMTTLEPGRAAELTASPFLLHPLPAAPSLCDLEFFEQGARDPKSIGRACWNGGKVTEAACPPNTISNAGVGPTGVTGIVTSVVPENADDIGFPAHLTIRYRATAHKDMPRGSFLVRMTSCPGHRADDTWHDELGWLRAGESIVAGQNTYKIGRPDPGTPCETVLGTAPKVMGEITEFATFCHRDTAITPGPCPR